MVHRTSSFRWGSALVPILSLGLALGACGNSPGTPDGDEEGGGGAGAAPDDDGHSPGKAEPIPLEELCPVFTRDLCRYLIECSGIAYRTLDDCVAEQDCYGLGELESSAASGAVEYHPETVGECHAEFEEDPCNFGFFLFTPDIYEVLSFCPGTLTPKLEVGDACVSDGECVEGLYCNKPDYQCPGVCEAPRTLGADCPSGSRCDAGTLCRSEVCVARPKAGDPCGETGCSSSVSCREGEICNGNLWCNAADVCEVGRGLDEPCGRIDGALARCAIGLYCEAETPLVAGSCKRPGGEGDDCNTDLDACRDGLQCLGAEIVPTPVRGKCRGPSPLGGACSRYDGCVEGLSCTEGICVEPLGVGASCVSSSACAEPLLCRGSACAEPVYLGDPCSAELDCDFGRCVEGRCVPRLRVGEPCEAHGDCSSNRCVEGACYDSSVCNAPEE